jgi:hypothetical protein
MPYLARIDLRPIDETASAPPGQRRGRVEGGADRRPTNRNASHHPPQDVGPPVVSHLLGLTASGEELDDGHEWTAWGPRESASCCRIRDLLMRSFNHSIPQKWFSRAIVRPHKKRLSLRSYPLNRLVFPGWLLLVDARRSAGNKQGS